MGKMDAGKLRDKAAAATAKGKHKKALGLYEKLSGLEPDNGMWSRKEGEMHRHLGDDTAAIASFERASERYAARGFVVKAVAVCKMILRIDPSQVRAQEQLVAFNTERGFVVASSSAAALPAQPGASVIENDVPLDALPLHKAAAGARPRLEEGQHSGIVEIPIDLEFESEAETPAASEATSEAKEALTATPLFEHLPPSSLRHLIAHVDFVELAAGEELFRQGDDGTKLYVVVEGRVSIVKETDGQGEVALGEMREGDFLGEVGLVTQQPRSATVRALVDSELLAISRKLVIEMIKDEPSVLTVLLRFLRERLINDLIKTSPLFAPFLNEQRHELIRRFGFLEVDAGTKLVRQGEHSPALFVVLAGNLTVNRVEGDGETRELATMHSGGIFGEMSLLAQSEAVATVQAESKCLLLELPKDVFRETIMTHPQVLAFVGDLASERERKLAAVADGEEQYEELHLDLF